MFLFLLKNLFSSWMHSYAGTASRTWTLTAAPEGKIMSNFGPFSKWTDVFVILDRTIQSKLGIEADFNFSGSNFKPWKPFYRVHRLDLKACNVFSNRGQTHLAFHQIQHSHSGRAVCVRGLIQSLVKNCIESKFYFMRMFPFCHLKVQDTIWGFHADHNSITSDKTVHLTRNTLRLADLIWSGASHLAHVTRPRFLSDTWHLWKLLNYKWFHSCCGVLYKCSAVRDWRKAAPMLSARAQILHKSS